MGIKDGKPCKKCGVFDYYKNGQCRPCSIAASKKWRNENPEKQKRCSKKWRENNADRHKSLTKKWKKDNWDKVLENNRKWKKNNPNKIKAINIARKTKQSKAGGAFTAYEWRELCKHYDYRCLGCGKKFPFKKLTVDHVLPVSMGGSSNIDNIQPLCQSCNSKKNAQYIDYRPDGELPKMWIQDKLL